MDCEPELLESSLFYHGTYLLDELHREQQMSSDSELSHWFQSHLPYTIAPKFVFVHLSRCIFDLGELCVYTSLCDVVPSRRAAPSLGYCSSCQPCVQFTHALRSSWCPGNIIKGLEATSCWFVDLLMAASDLNDVNNA